MTKIVSVIAPFDMNQHIYVFENGLKVDQLDCSLKNLAESILDISSKYIIDEINISGPKHYSAKIKNQILKADLTKYKKFDPDKIIIL